MPSYCYVCKRSPQVLSHFGSEHPKFCQTCLTRCSFGTDFASEVLLSARFYPRRSILFLRFYLRRSFSLSDFTTEGPLSNFPSEGPSVRLYLIDSFCQILPQKVQLFVGSYLRISQFLSDFTTELPSFCQFSSEAPNSGQITPQNSLQSIQSLSHV